MEALYKQNGIILSDWFAENMRDLPWRHTRDPYAIWVSEIMLQQTRVEAVIETYIRFLQKFPDVAALAAASGDMVRLAWQGLGYYRRAEYLHRGAQYICQQYGGVFPCTLEAIRHIPGIGEYTAGAIAAFAFDIPVPAVDGNVLRVLSRMYDIHDCVDFPQTRKWIADIAREMIPEGRVWQHNQALMELGALVCLPGSPRCDNCPITDSCMGRTAGTQWELPVKKEKKKPVTVMRRVYLVRRDDFVLVHQRPGEGLLAGMWEFPGDDTPDMLTLLGHLQVKGFLLHARHVFTHIVWEMEGMEATADASLQLPDISWKWVRREELSDYAFPSAMKAFLQLIV